MEKDLARDIARRRGEIAAIDPGDDPARIQIKQSLAGALYAIWMAARHDHPARAHARAKEDPERERAVLRLLVEGHTYQEVSQALYISLNTVKTHLRRARLALAKELIRRRAASQREVAS